MGNTKQYRNVKLYGKLVRSPRTQKFRVQDLGFWTNGKMLSRHDTLNKVLEADSVTLKIQTRKTEEWGKPYTTNKRLAREPWKTQNTGYTTYRAIKET